MRKLLTLSLFLNLCLGALVGYEVLTRPKAEPAAAGSGKTAGIEPGQKFEMPESRRDWVAMKSADWKEFARNLRKTGCPEDTMRDILFGEVNKAYAARWRSLNGDDGKKYWVSKREGWWGHTKQKEFNALERERKALIKQLTGMDADRLLRQYMVLNYDTGVETRNLDFLPADRRKKLNEMLDKDDEGVQAVWLKQEPGGGLPQAAQHELNLALQKRKDDLANALSEPELEEYELRNSQTAKDLRRQLYGFDATEQEFRAIFKAQKKLHDQFADIPFNPTDEATNQKREVAAEAAEREIHDALGEKRYADYLRTKNVQYQRLLNFTDEFEMSKEVANQAYDIIQRAQENLRRLEGNTDMLPEHRQARVSAVQAETDAALAQVMGEKGLKYFKQNYGGWGTNAAR